MVSLALALLLAVPVGPSPTPSAKIAKPVQAVAPAPKTQGGKKMPESCADYPDSYWKEKLSPEAYAVMRKQGTERAFTGAYWNNHDKGKYLCAACGAELFG